jgi:hypothetical protein
MCETGYYHSFLRILSLLFYMHHTACRLLFEDFSEQYQQARANFGLGFDHCELDFGSDWDSIRLHTSGEAGRQMRLVVYLSSFTPWYGSKR